MADNVAITAGSGTTIASDDIGGVHYQIIKVGFGVLDSVTLASSSNGLPVAQQGTWNVTNAGTFATQAACTVADGADVTFGAKADAKNTATDTTAISAMSVLKQISASVQAPPSQAVTNSGTFAVQVTSIAAGTNNIGDVDVLTVPADPFGVNADAASATGSISAKLRFIAATGIPITSAIPAGTNNIGDVDVLTVPADPFGANADAASATGSISAKLRFIAATGIPITNTVTVGSHAVTNAGTFAVQVDGAALTSLQLIDDAVFADEAAFTVASSKVHTIGLHSVVCGAAPDSAAVDAAVNPVATRTRVPFVIGGDPGVITVKHTTITTAVTDIAIVTVTTPNKIVVTRISVSLDNASTVFPTVLIGFGAANTPTTTGVLFAHGGFPAGGQATVGDGSGILGVGADAEDLRITTTGNATGNGLQVVITYFLVPS